MTNSKLSPDKARELLIRRGNLDFMRRPLQKVLKQKLEEYNRNYMGDPLIMLCHRGFGKSTAGGIHAKETEIQRPGSYSLILGPTIVLQAKIMAPIFKDINSKMPIDLQSRYDSTMNLWKNPQGGGAIIAGYKDGVDTSMRGVSLPFVLFDEFGFCSDISKVLGTINPRRVDVKGTLLMTTTPPRSPSHPSVAYIEDARREGRLLEYTVYDNPIFTPTDIAIMAKQARGVDSNEFRREYLCEIIVDERYQILKEPWDIEDFSPTPGMYGALTYRGGGLTAFVAGFKDRDNRLRIFEERSFMQAPLPEVGAFLKEFKSRNPSTIIYVDAMPEETMILGQMGLPVCIPPNKLLKPADIPALRTVAGSTGLVVHDQCRETIRHLKHGVYEDEAHKKFDASGTDEYFEFIVSVALLCRYCPDSGRPPAMQGLGTRPAF